MVTPPEIRNAQLSRRMIDVLVLMANGARLRESQRSGLVHWDTAGIPGRRAVPLSTLRALRNRGLVERNVTKRQPVAFADRITFIEWRITKEGRRLAHLQKEADRVPGH